MDTVFIATQPPCIAQTSVVPQDT